MKTETRQCQNCKTNFTIEPEDFQFYEKIQVPPPTFCPDCRLQRRLAFRNERTLYKDRCDLCGQSIISMYAPGRPFKVYCPSCFHSDKWDPGDYAEEYDFSKPFFTQFRELVNTVPHLALLQENSVDSPWTNYELDDKNCYFNFGGHYNENCAYNQYSLKSRDCFDNYWLMKAEFSYDNIMVENAYEVFFSKHCLDCQNTYFSFDCRNCTNIIGCTGLRHKQNYIFNQPVSKEEFAKFKEESHFGRRINLEKIREKSKLFIKSQPQKAVMVEKSVNSSGNNLYTTKNCQSCWLSEKTEDSKHVLFSLNLKDSMDISSIWGGELCYEFLAGAEQLSNMKFMNVALKGCTNVEYSQLVIGSNNCFGSVNIKSKNYCILNKQYSKEEYEILIPKIKKHMSDMPYTDRKGRIYKYGEFFPTELSDFAYNESVAAEFFPMSEDEAKTAGFNWQDTEKSADYQFSTYEIPDDIKDVKDDILEKILKCEVSGKAYRIIPMELQFYRRFNLPIPHVSPFERHKIRMRFIADHLELKQRKCLDCDKLTDTVYTEEEFPKIYCEACYLKNII